VVSALHQRDLQTNVNYKNNFSPLVFERKIAAFSNFDSQRKYVRYFNLLHLGTVPYLTSLPFPNFAFCLQNIEEAELKFLMTCVTNQTKCVNNPEEKHKEIKEESYNNL